MKALGEIEFKKMNKLISQDPFTPKIDVEKQ